MKANKLFMVFAASTIIAANLTSIVLASNDSTDPKSISEDSITRSEVTEYKYTYIDGVLYKRLWSVTYNHWIDPYWIPA